jgi:hypothetical protein
MTYIIILMILLYIIIRYTCRASVPRTRTRLAIWACETDVDVDANAAGQAVVHGTPYRPARLGC